MELTHRSPHISAAGFFKVDFGLLKSVRLKYGNKMSIKIKEIFWIPDDGRYCDVHHHISPIQFLTSKGHRPSKKFYQFYLKRFSNIHTDSHLFFMFINLKSTLR